jgi:ABC-type transport system substrate-binding protein
MHLGAAADAPDPAIYHDVVIGLDGNGYFPTHFNNPEYAALLEQAGATADALDRIALYQQAEQLLIEKYTAIIPVSNQNLIYMLRDGWDGLEFPFGLRGPIYANLTFSD